MHMNYNSNQDPLKINLSWEPRFGHVAWAINTIVNDIPQTVIQATDKPIGRPAYPVQLLLKLLLFGYLRHTFSGRQLARMAHENVVMRWFLGNKLPCPSYRTLNRFRSSPHTKVLLASLFKTFRHYLHLNGLIDDSALFIDGTKILANANKYTFVWRKAIAKAEANLDKKTDQLYQTLIDHQIKIPVSQQPLTSDDLIKIATILTTMIACLTTQIAHEKPRQGGSARKRVRRKLRHLLHQLATDFIPRKLKYEYDDATFGERNSFSKTDVDATFMRMKEDPMKNGQLKPGYNLQVACQNQYALYYQLFSNPTDTRTLIPFVTNIFGQSPKAVHWIVADAGYGSESNYQSLTDDFDLHYLIPYGMYEKEQKRRYHKDRKHLSNWSYNEQRDEYTDLDGIVFTFHNYSTRHDRYGDTRQFKVYRSVQYFEDAQREKLATTKSGHRRQISVNYNWLYFKNLAKTQLQSDFGHQLYACRKHEIEPVFADLKTYLKLHRFSVRGHLPVSNEIGIALMANNLLKLSKIPNQTYFETIRKGGNYQESAITTS